MIFDQDYYLNGPETGKSNYTNYTWMPRLTNAYAERLSQVLDIQDDDTFLDFGCARGYLVKAMMMRGIDAYGCDISEWAINNCDADVVDFVSTDSPDSFGRKFDWVHAKDVFEHIPESILEATLKELISVSKNGIFIIVPLVDPQSGHYLYPADNRDPSHVIKWTFGEWMAFLTEAVPEDWIVNGSFNIPGLKQASIDYPYSTGFFTLIKK